MKRNFNLGAVLSVAGDRLMCDMGEVYEILSFMAGDSLWTSQLPRTAKECRPTLLKQHPFLSEYLKDIEPTISADNYSEKLAECISKWGSKVAVKSLRRSRTR